MALVLGFTSKRKGVSMGIGFWDLGLGCRV
jgi:hypothetical protein